MMDVLVYCKLEKGFQSRITKKYNVITENYFYLSVITPVFALNLHRYYLHGLFT